MHWNFQLAASQILWTLTFAALLVLLVVLLGRDRVGRYPCFTGAVVLAILQMLARQLLAQRVDPLLETRITLTLADLGVVATFLVVIEMARRAFAAASRKAWLLAAFVVLALGAAILALGGHWPSPQTLFANSTLAHLRLMQFAAEKGDLLNNLLFLELTLLVVAIGSRFQAGWRSHTRQILFGYSLSGIAQIAVLVVWERLARSGVLANQAAVDRRAALQSHLLIGGNLVYLAAVMGWIICLWLDQPGVIEPAMSIAGREEPGTEVPGLEELDSAVLGPPREIVAPEDVSPANLPNPPSRG